MSLYCTENRSSHSVLGRALCRFPLSRCTCWVSFFWVSICLIFRIRKQYFCSVYSPGWTYYFLYNAQLGGRGWDGQTVDTWLSYIHIYIYEMTCMYVYAYTCVCIHIHTDFYLRLSQKWRVCVYTYTIFKTIWDKNYSSLNHSSITTVLIWHSCEYTV